jgi:hypothetical protein
LSRHFPGRSLSSVKNGFMCHLKMMGEEMQKGGCKLE